MTEVLDISQAVTREQYTTVLRSLLDQFENWRDRQGWCTDLYYYVGQLTRTFKWDPEATGVLRGRYDGEMTLDIPENRTGEEMAQDLREIRGRILQFTVSMSDTLSAAKALEFLQVSGLPLPDGESRVEIDITGRVTTSLASEEIRERATAFLASLGEDPGPPGVYVRQLRFSIPSSEMTELLPRR